MNDLTRTPKKDNDSLIIIYRDALWYPQQCPQIKVKTAIVGSLQTVYGCAYLTFYADPVWYGGVVSFLISGHADWVCRLFENRWGCGLPRHHIKPDYYWNLSNCIIACSLIINCRNFYLHLHWFGDVVGWVYHPKILRPWLLPQFLHMPSWIQ